MDYSPKLTLSNFSIVFKDFVASTPILVVVPSLSATGSSDEPRTLGTIIMSLSPLTRVAIAYSTSSASNTLTSVSTTTQCYKDGWADNAAIIAFLPSPSVCLLIETAACNQQQPPSVKTTFSTVGTAFFTDLNILGS